MLSGRKTAMALGWVGYHRAVAYHGLWVGLALLAETAVVPWAGYRWSVANHGFLVGLASVAMTATVIEMEWKSDDGIVNECGFVSISTWK